MLHLQQQYGMQYNMQEARSWVYGDCIHAATGGCLASVADWDRHSSNTVLQYIRAPGRCYGAPWIDSVRISQATEGRRGTSRGLGQLGQLRLLFIAVVREGPGKPYREKAFAFVRW